MDLLMVRERATGRFVYTEWLERRPGETPWEYVRRSVRREARIRTRFDADATEVIVGWGVDSVEDFLRANPEYRSDGRSSRSEGRSSDGDPGGTSGGLQRGERLEGDIGDG